jgi:hypothetical protein
MILRPLVASAVFTIGLAGWAGPVAANDPAALHAIHAELVKLRQPAVSAGVPDYTPEAIERQKKGLAELRRRLDAIDPRSWPVPDQVDYLLVRSQMAGLDFGHRDVRPWARDPGFYNDLIDRVAYSEPPAAAEKLEQLGQGLRAVPRILEQAKRNLTSGSAELAGIAIFHLERSDGVNQGEPRRDPPPEGILGWYNDLIGRLTKHHPDLVGHARQALAAVESYRDWLKQNENRMKEPAWVGLEQYQWCLKNVSLIPLTVDEVRWLGQRELARARTFLEIEENKNRSLPKLEPVTNAEEHARRVAEGEKLIRKVIQDQKLLTIPPDFPAEFETDAFFIERPGGHRHFWEEIGYRDVLNNHLHASIPGHRFDGLLQRRTARPIRRGHRDGARGEGWGFYIEEMFLQAGLLEERPRARELFYVAQIKRAVRIAVELRMQTGEFDLARAIRFMVDEVPLMEENLARYDLEGYIRNPTYGANYFIGKAQIENLLSERALELGDRFDLGAFHDDFLSRGSIPVSLIRWEMTGKDDEIRKLW